MRLKWADQALTDVRQIERWLGLNVDPVVAEEALHRIRRQAHGLLHFPRRKPRLGRGRHYSQVERTSYLLIYSVSRGFVTILRVRHNKEDWRP